MRLDSLLKRGGLHEVYGEDAQYHINIGNDWLIAAVMDGCSSGKDSYFASTLFVKLLRKSCRTLPLLAEINPDLNLHGFTPRGMGEYILRDIFYDVKRTRKLLLADPYELLSTLVLLVFHKPSKSAFLMASGDGFLRINDEFVDLDQNNVPDYMSYHLGLNFDEWLTNHTRAFERENVQSVFISTDGIEKYLDENKKPSKKINTVSYFLNKNGKSLGEKDKTLQTEYQLYPFDDVSILSLETGN